MRIKSAKDQFSVQKAGGYRQFVELHSARRWQTGVNWEVRGIVAAEIHRSAWVVSCPFCRNAQVAEFGEPFFCVDCVMQGNGFKAMGIIFPENIDKIERILLKRPDPNTRNWLLGETIEQLIAENIDHEVEV